MSETKSIRVLVWDENPSHSDKKLYPGNLRAAIAEGLNELSVGGELVVKTANLDEPNQGVTDELLAETDVLIWWGHARHGEVEDSLAERVKERAYKHGLGVVVLHSGHYSKVFKAVVDGTGHLKGGWRESTDSETIRVCAPWHPVAAGVEDFVLENEEMYGAPFDVPPCETLVFQSLFSVGGESFPSGMAWTVGEGIDPEFTSGPGGGKGQGEGKCRLFYFRPGHETYPTYLDSRVRKVIYNAVRWAGRLV